MNFKKWIAFMTAGAVAAGAAAAGTAQAEEQNNGTSEEAIKIMCMGDSITDGYIDGNHGYRKYLYHNLTKAGLDIDMVGNKGNNWDYSNSTYTKSDGTIISYDPANEGYSQAFTSTGSWNIKGIIDGSISSQGNSGNTVAANQPDIIVLLIGTNDCMGEIYDDGLSADEYETRLLDLTTEIFKQKSDTELILMSPPPVYADSPSGTWLAGCQEIIDSNIRNCIKGMQEVIAYENSHGHKCTYLDLNSEFVNNEEHPDYTSLLYDYAHPNETGYEVMGDFIAEFLIEYLGGSSDITTTTATDSTTTTTTTTTTITTTATTAVSTEATENTTTTTGTATTVTTEDIIVAPFKKGDANNDGIINMLDIVLVRKYLVGAVAKSEINIDICDMDSSGGVNIFDAVRILKILIEAE